MATQADYDYILVGSGAGGGPLAANLARKGYKVLVLEAGQDQGTRPTYQVPVFHGFATEDKTMEWDYFVRHYSNDDQQKRDSKYCEQRNGVWYPRAGTLGGCTAHNAMITIYGCDKDWDDIASLFRSSAVDPKEKADADSWNSTNMRTYFERLERCEYVNAPDNGHGFDGWLTTSTADPTIAVGDPQLLTVIASAAVQALLSHVAKPSELAMRLLGWLKLVPDAGTLIRLAQLILQDPFDAQKVTEILVSQATNLVNSLFDPNDSTFVTTNNEGPIVVPLAVKGGKQDPAHRGWRNSTREFLLETQKSCPAPGKLDIWYETLVTRVLFKDSPTLTAIGVAYVKKQKYAADPSVNDVPRPSLEEFRKLEQQVIAAREVILCAGTFNTPQLLMLSGIGPKDQIEQFKGPDGKPTITCRKNLPGVGTNLQDRYEVGVNCDMKMDFPILKRATFKAPDPGPAFEQAKQADPVLKQWADEGTGLYATNGAVLGIILRSDPQCPDPPDLFVFALPGYFKGYFKGYSTKFEAQKNQLTWAVLKAHTKNTAGYVRLKSADPRDVPEINFKYFEEGNAGVDDLNAIVAGVRFVRKITDLSASKINSVTIGGKSIQNDDDIPQLVKNEAWGHHASCTCPLGPEDKNGVLDSRFRVHGVKNLRVVDASVFQRIPGFFIVTPIYMISEKATDMIHEDAEKS